jgi:hypothetical protein
MKYIKKVISTNISAKRRSCVDEGTYLLYTQDLARISARADAENRIPKQVSSQGCTWRTIAEVRDARYQLKTDGAYGLAPLPRCQNQDTRFDILGGMCTQPGLQRKETTEYRPGGGKPPCSNSVCPPTPTTKVQKDSPGSTWHPVNKKTAGVRVVYSYRWRPLGVISFGPSQRGAGDCPIPSPGNWIAASINVTNATLTDETKCQEETKTYNCCCSCPPNQVKIPQLSPGLAPCQNLRVNQQQLYQLRSAIEGALIAGACIAAAVLAAKFTAIAIAAYTAAGCAYTMITITPPPCQNR